jgi:dihydrodipicolinate synthase/N-acetylneuraminate lyase
VTVITAEQAMQRWRGVLAPLVTPFRPDGPVALDTLQSNVQWLIDQGANQQNTVLLAAGSGGDFTSMNLDERKAVIRAVAEVVGGRIPIVAGVQALDLRDCIALCQWSEACGVDAAQISGPFYYDGRPGDVVAWLAEVARHTGIGFALYNNWYTGYNMPLDLIEELLALPNSVAIKWSSPDAELFVEGARRFSPRVAVVNNTFLTILGHLAGCRVFVSHWPNFYPAFCWRIWDLLEAHQYDQAQREFEQAMVPYRALVGRITSQTAGEGVFVRAAMQAVGLDGGCSRLPSRDAVVTPEIVDGFRRHLTELRVGDGT